MIGDKVRSEIIKRVKLAKYFAVILDCTPDMSHTEQLSLIQFDTFPWELKHMSVLWWASVSYSVPTMDLFRGGNGPAGALELPEMSAQECKALCDLRY